MSELTQELQQAAAAARDDEEALAALADDLSGSSRRARQKAASTLAVIARDDASVLVPYGAAVVDALNRPEAQTRWECLDVLTALVTCDSRTCDKALAGAEAALFDEDSGLVRLAAMRFLCRLGSTTERRSQKTWPLIDEALQCYHGDPEFQDMLIAVIDYSAGKLSKDVKAGLVARMTFDAEHGKGALKRRASQIVDNAKA